MRTPRPCPACTTSGAGHGFTVSGYEFSRCLSCGTHYVDPVPDEDALASLYAQPGYYDGARRQEDRMRAQAEARAAVLAEMGVGSVLDIGCASGYFLDAARDRRIEVEGVEPGPAGADAIARGHRVHRCWLRDLGALERRFDAVSLWEVIEHVGEPAELLTLSAQALAPGGLVALSTPSMSGVPARLLGRRFPMVTPPEHLTLLTRRGLGVLLSRVGFEEVRCTSFSNLGPEQISSGLRRFVVGDSRVAGAVAQVVGRAASVLVAPMDRLGLGSELEMYARQGRA